MTHHIKLALTFCQPVMTGQKRFEIRYNDRDYRTGDYIAFIPADPETGRRTHHPIASRKYRITYLLSGWGLKDGYVAFGIEEDNSEQNYER